MASSLVAVLRYGISSAAIASPTDIGGAVGRTTIDTKRVRIGSPTLLASERFSGLEMGVAVTHLIAKPGVSSPPREPILQPCDGWACVCQQIHREVDRNLRFPSSCRAWPHSS
jgi:hypothetical protein